MRLFAYVTASCALCACCAPAFAASPPTGWSGNIQLGGVQTTGNTQSSTANGKFKLNYLRAPWQNTLRFSGLYASSDGTTNAQSWEGSNQTRYSFSKHNYLFGLINAQAVRFSGYDYQVSEVAGLGRRLYDSARQTLDVEIGAGARQSRLTEGGARSVGIGRLGLGYEFDITAHSSFTQHVSSEIGVNNTFVKAVSALKMSIYGALSANLSYTISHNSNVPAGTRKTDTISSVTLEYDF
ncbi:DUF481 domain-containing protein [Acidihalobacter prosperus]|uniref:DUF481 domain-containing protein n=1 Tax=Acidihalobacter prosperus TaxID=160660 RepID=A0A1A6C0I4_9GAMM|nr:DUF481 domain-containing protein [Acidihalobacter prosperus]OBS08065.1 hypothetical protein Thpro_022315 [Acidihalobacter prosperus]